MKMIREIRADSRGSYGSSRVHAELRLGLGIEVIRKRAERLMRQAGIQGIYRRKGRHNLVNQATEEDLVRRQFTVETPDRLWLADITEHPAGDGKLYCAAVMDAYSRRIIGCPHRRRSSIGMRSPVTFESLYRPPDPST
jgi:putative transposase